MLNTMVVVKMKKTNFSEWKKLFDGDAENRAKFAGKYNHQQLIEM